MARKMKRIHAPAVSVVDAPRSEPLQAPPEASKPRIGRPATRPETIARQQAEDAGKGRVALAPALSAQVMSPDEMRPLTIGVLRLIALGIKGDAPTMEEVEQVNPAATAVANKYTMSTKWAPELALLGALVVVGAQMKKRAQVKRAATTAGKPNSKGGDKSAERDRGNTRAEGIGEKSGIPLAVVEAVESARR